MRGVVAIGEARPSRQPQPDISSSGGLNKYLNTSGPGPEYIEKRKQMPGQEGQTSAGGCGCSAMRRQGWRRG
jgi:hypothetical protein